MVEIHTAGNTAGPYRWLISRGKPRIMRTHTGWVCLGNRRALTLSENLMQFVTGSGEGAAIAFGESPTDAYDKWRKKAGY